MWGGTLARNSSLEECGGLEEVGRAERRGWCCGAVQASGERGWQKGKGGSLDLVQVRRTPCLPGLRYAGEGGSSGSWEGAAETVLGGSHVAVTAGGAVGGPPRALWGRGGGGLECVAQ